MKRDVKEWVGSTAVINVLEEKEHLRNIDIV